MRELQYLLLIILSLVVDDVEEAELVDTLGGGDDTEPVTELLLLEELLGTILRIESAHNRTFNDPLLKNRVEKKRTGT